MHGYIITEHHLIVFVHAVKNAVLWNFFICVDSSNDCHNQDSEWFGYHK